MISFLKRRKYITRIGELGFIIFLSALAISLVDTIWAVYLYQYLQSSVLVGLISTFFTVISLLSFILLIPFLEKHSCSSLYAWTLALMGISYLLFAFTESFWVIILLGIFLSILTVIRIDSFGILVSDNSRRKDLAKHEGIIYTTANLGWLVGPLIAGFISGRYGIPLIFILSAFFFFLSFLSYRIFYICSRKRTIQKLDGDILGNIKDFFSNRDLLKAYIVSDAPSIWWVFTFIYIPLYIIAVWHDS